MQTMQVPVAKELPSWLTQAAEPVQELTQRDFELEIEDSSKPRRKPTGCSNTGEKFHLQQQFATGAIVVGRWARKGNVTMRECRPTNPDLQFGRDVVAPLAVVARPGEAGEVATTLIVESCQQWHNKTDFTCLFKIPAEHKEWLVNSDKVKAHKILTLDRQDYLRCDFQVPNWVMPVWFRTGEDNNGVARGGVDQVGDDAVTVQIQSVRIGANDDVAWYDLAVIDANRVPGGRELIGYLDAMAAKRSRHEAILAKLRAKKGAMEAT